ncbi:MAG: restriction endonuclease subunit S [Nonlabens sp.]
MEIKALSEIAEIRTGNYDANHSTENGLYKFYTCAFEQLRSPTYSFEGKAIVLPGNGANVGEVFYNHVEKFEAYQRTYVVSNLKAHVPYVYFYFKRFWKQSLKNSQYGSATNYIRLGNLSQFEIPLPDLIAQKRIAQVLSDCEELIRLRKQSIALLDELVKSTFLEMFGDPVRNEMGWDIVNIDHFAINKNSDRVPIKNSDRQKIKGNYPYYGATGIVDHINDFKFIGQHLLIAEDGKNLITRNKDIAFEADGKFWVNNHAHVFKIKDGNFIHFVKNMFNFYDIRAFVTGIDQFKLNRSNLDRIPLIYPTLNSQKRFHDIVNKIQQNKVFFQNHLKELEHLYARLSQDSFKGELDLSKVVLDEKSRKMGNESKAILEPFQSYVEKHTAKPGLKEHKKQFKTEKRSEGKVDISNLSLANYLGIPNDIQNERDNIDFDFLGEDIFYQFALKNHFNRRSFDFDEMQKKMHTYFYIFGEVDFPYEKWKEILFKFIDKDIPLVEQFFDETSMKIKLKLTDEAFKA